MAKDRVSLWDDSGDDDEGLFRDATQRSGPRPNKDKVFYRDDFTEEDPRSSDEYGGFGYSGSSSSRDYDYRGSFDDSDDYWYRRNSFRYSRNVDYSPSSLFRSAFSTRRFESGSDNDVKNKAIRALRTLTRNGNTIVDKALSREPFVVQFSSGADSNGVTDNLNEDKQRVVYVSPDQLMDTKTTDDEDAAVDALTGFVLLRVQIAQGVAPAVIRELNKTNAQNVAAQLAVRVMAQKKPLADVDHPALTADVIDNCLAGMLTKSLLMRLSRRQVVSNWGGFAPYFVRHAKQFAAVKENLNEQALSLETLVGKIAYNMIADEDQIELPEGIEPLVAKHLGAELDSAAFLTACRALVSDLRAALAATGTDPAGAMEKALNEMFDKAKKDFAGGGADKSTRDALGNMLDGVGAGLAFVNKAQEKLDSHGASSATQDSLRQLLSIEQITKKINDRIEDLKAASATEYFSKDKNYAEEVTRTVQRELAYAISGKPAGRDALRDSSAGKEFKALEAAITGPHRYKSDAAEALTEAAEKFKTKVEKVSKERRAMAKESAKDSIAKMQAAVAEMQTDIKTVKDIVTARTLDNMRNAAPAEIKNEIHEFLSSALRDLDSAADVLTGTAGDLTRFMTALSGARAAKSIAKAHSDATTRFNRGVREAYAYVMRKTWGSKQTERLLEAARGRFDSTPGLHADDEDERREAEKEWKEKSIDDVVNYGKLTDDGVMASILHGADDSVFKEAVKGGAESEAVREMLGISPGDLAKMLEHISSAVHATGGAEAQQLGKDLSKKLQKGNAAVSPVDEQLFGAKVENKMKVLDGRSVGHVNDEARNDPEEEYIAYLRGGDSDSTKPTPVVKKESHLRRAVTGGLARAKEVLKRHRGTIERIRNALQFQSGKRTEETYGLRSGDLDEGGLHKLSYDCDHIWAQKTISRLPDVAVGILVDQSGSMGGIKIDQARELCIVLAEALKKIKGVRLYIYGHTANCSSASDLVILEHYVPGQPDALAKLGDISAHTNNYDGYAIKDVAKRLSADPAKRKYLFVIADGLPAGSGYGGDTANKHVASVCKFVRERLKISTYAFAVGVSTYEHDAFKRQYGADHVVFVNNVLKCLPQIVRFLRNTLQKEKKLVGVAD